MKHNRRITNKKTYTDYNTWHKIHEYNKQQNPHIWESPFFWETTNIWWKCLSLLGKGRRSKSLLVTNVHPKLLKSRTNPTNKRVKSPNNISIDTSDDKRIQNGVSPHASLSITSRMKARSFNKSTMKISSEPASSAYPLREKSYPSAKDLQASF